MLIYVHDILQLLHFLGVRGVRTATLQPRIKFSIGTINRRFRSLTGEFAVSDLPAEHYFMVDKCCIRSFRLNLL